VLQCVVAVFAEHLTIDKRANSRQLFACCSVWMCCTVLQRVAVCCSVADTRANSRQLQRIVRLLLWKKRHDWMSLYRCDSVCCSVLQCVAKCCRVLQSVAGVAVRYSVLTCVALCCSVSTGKDGGQTGYVCCIDINKCIYVWNYVCMITFLYTYIYINTHVTIYMYMYI